MSPAMVMGEGTLAAALRAEIDAASPPPAIFMIAAAGEDAALSIARLREAPAPPGGATVLIIAADVPALDRALLLAAMAPIAIERAPAVRVSAIDIAPGAGEDAVVSAALFLAAAGCTTGQQLRIG